MDASVLFSQAAARRLTGEGAREKEKADILLTKGSRLVPVVPDDLVACDIDLALVLVGSVAGDLAGGGLNGASFTNGRHV